MKQPRPPASRTVAFFYGPLHGATLFRESQLVSGLLYIGLLWLAGHVLSTKGSLGPPHSAHSRTTPAGRRPRHVLGCLGRDSFLYMTSAKAAVHYAQLACSSTCGTLMHCAPADVVLRSVDMPREIRVGPGQPEDAQALITKGIRAAEHNFARLGHPGWCLYDERLADKPGVVYDISKQRTPAVELVDTELHSAAQAGAFPWEAVEQVDEARGKGMRLPEPPVVDELDLDELDSSGVPCWVDPRQLVADAMPGCAVAKRSLSDVPQCTNKCAIRSSEHARRAVRCPSVPDNCT